MEQFAKDLAIYKYLADFHYGQIGYVRNRGWVFFDYGYPNEKFNLNGAEDIREDHPLRMEAYRFTESHKDIIDQINNAVYEERLRLILSTN